MKKVVTILVGKYTQNYGFKTVVSETKLLSFGDNDIKRGEENYITLCKDFIDDTMLMKDLEYDKDGIEIFIEKFEIRNKDIDLFDELTPEDKGTNGWIIAFSWKGESEDDD